MRMRRRQFVVGTGAGARAAGGVWAAAVAVASARHGPRPGLLLQGTEGSLRRRLDALQQGLREYSYLEGQNLVIERRFDNGLDERLPGLADDLVQLPVDVIVAAASNAVLAVLDVD